MESTNKIAEARPKKRTAHPVPRWLVALLTAVITFSLTLCAVGVLLGQHGIAVVQGWVLARWAFVEEDADLKAASDGALEGMVNALGDRWSYYVNAEEYAALIERRANQYVGIGVTVDYSREDGIYIRAVTPGSPAEKAGLLAGEVIIEVQGVTAAGDARYEAVELIGGQPGEERTLRVRDATGKEREVTLTLAAIAVEVAKGYLTEDGVGVVTLANFNSNSAKEFQEVTEDLVEQGARALVFDVRGNGGGYVAELTEILDYLLPEGVVFQSKPRWGFRYEKESDEECVDLPFAVLVDADTYSAAELFAAELREMRGAHIVGEVTSGKGYSQNLFSFLNGGAAGLSTACYFTGEGVSLIGAGITPDVLLSLTDEAESLRSAGVLKAENDPQLQAALKLLQE